MLSKNTEVFMGCDWEPEEADTILFGAPLTLPLPTGRAQGSAAALSAMRLTAWKTTALIRTEI